MRISSFDTLRERNTAAVAHNEAKAATAKPGRTQNRFHTRIQTLLGQRVELENLASTQDVRDEYGAEAWHERFILLRELPPDERDAAWLQLAKSHYRLFQELFCQPHQASVPRSLPKQPGGGERLTVDGCLPSADRVRPDLLLDVGLLTKDEWEEAETQLDKLALIKSKIPALQHLWNNAEDLEPGNMRWLVVKQGPHAEHIEPLEPRVPGSLLYTREMHSGDEAAFHLRTVQYFPNALSAYRKTWHQEAAYHEETDLLMGLHAELDMLRTLLNEEWTRNAPEERKAELRTHTQETIARWTKVLASCTNKHKAESYEFLAKALTFEDKTGKPNVSVVMTRITGALGRIEPKRGKEMTGKSGYNQRDRQALHRRIAQEEGRLLYFRRAVEGAAHEFERNPSADVRERLRHAVSALRTIGLAPFNVWAEKLAQEHEALLQTQEPAGIREKLVSLHVIGKFQGLVSDIERMKLFLAQEKDLNIPRLMEFAEQVRTAFGTRQVFPAETVEALKPVFETLLKEVERMATRLQHYQKHPPIRAERREVKKNLKKFLNGLNVESLLSGSHASSNEHAPVPPVSPAEKPVIS